MPGQSRSTSNYCREGIAYCNEYSIWTSACVTPNLPTNKPTTKIPTASGETSKPTMKPVVIIPPPTSTGENILGVGCTGEACTDITHC